MFGLWPRPGVPVRESGDGERWSEILRCCCDSALMLEASGWEAGKPPFVSMEG